MSEGKNEIEDIFGVTFSEKKNATKNDNLETVGKQPYWIHWSEDKTKLVINTYQLSMGISDDLLKELANEIKNSNLL